MAQMLTRGDRNGKDGTISYYKSKPLFYEKCTKTLHRNKKIGGGSSLNVPIKFVQTILWSRIGTCGLPINHMH